MNLHHRVAWVTGAGKRLGREIAIELARRGCHLAIHYGTSAAEAHEVAKAAERIGRRTLVYRADLTRVDEIQAMARQIENEFGRLDILVNTAANFERVSVEEITEAHWDRALDVNLKASAFCALEAARLMRLKRESGETLAAPRAAADEPHAALIQQAFAPTDDRISANLINLDNPADGLTNTLVGESKPDATDPSQSRPAPPPPPLWGKIINFADWSALRPYRNYLPYMISKGGIVTLTQALAQELAPQITVNAIAPGTVLPPPDTTPEELARIERNIPLGRIGTPGDIVATALYLLEATDYVSGQILCVDGGRYVAQPPQRA